VRATRALALASIGEVLLFALLLGQALGLPEVEDPIPDRIGLDYVFSAAGAGGVVGGVISLIAWPRRKERFISLGTFGGFCLGLGFYALSLFVQLFFVYEIFCPKN
jgi:hypothetical protein